MATQPEKIVKDQSNNLYLKNLSDEVDEYLLTYVFSNFGIITNAEVMRENGISKGFGYVCFSSPDEAAKAINAMNSKIFCGKPLHIDLAQKKEEKAAMMVQNAPVAATQDVQQMLAPAAAPHDILGMTSAILFNLTPEERMEMIGESIYEQVKAIYPDIAGKITGMLLEIDQGVLLYMIVNPETFRRLVEEAVAVLKAHQIQKKDA